MLWVHLRLWLFLVHFMLSSQVFLSAFIHFLFHMLQMALLYNEWNNVSTINSAKSYSSKTDIGFSKSADIWYTYQIMRNTVYLMWLTIFLRSLLMSFIMLPKTLSPLTVPGSDIFTRCESYYSTNEWQVSQATPTHNIQEQRKQGRKQAMGYSTPTLREQKDGEDEMSVMTVLSF